MHITNCFKYYLIFLLEKAKVSLSQIFQLQQIKYNSNFNFSNHRYNVSRESE